MSLDFPPFALSEEHEALRESVRALADDKIAPRAAEIDRTGEFPWDVYEALVKADLHAVHIPEAYGGGGADAIAAAIVIEEVARACASSSLIPSVNKLGTMPLILAASEEVKARYLTPVARGEAMFSYALSEPEAGSDAAAMKTRAVRSQAGYVLNGVKRWITNAGISKYYTVMAVTDPSLGPNGISAFVVEDGDPGFSFGAPEHKLGIKGSPTRELYFDEPDPGIPAHRRRGRGVQDRPAHAGPHPDHDRGPGPGDRPGRAGLRPRLRQGTQAVRARDRGVPGPAVHGRGHGHEARGGPPAHLRRRGQVGSGHGRGEGRGPDVLLLGEQVPGLRCGDVGDHRRGPATRRLRLRQRLPGRAHDARREDHPDLRRHQPDPARGHGPPAPEVAGWLTFPQDSPGRKGGPNGPHVTAEVPVVLFSGGRTVRWPGGSPAGGRRIRRWR